MIAADSFTIERHALRIRQPITVLQNETAVINCFKEGLGSRFGRLDYSKGFSDWWFLSHIDIHTPSEHTQEGQRYDAELQLHHFYSVSASIANNNAGTENELGTVTMFMQVYEDAPPYRDLDGVICLWRRKEAETREACGLDPITSHYPGCFPIQNRNLRNTKDGGSDAPTKGKTPYPKDKTFATFQDLLIAHDRRNREIELGLDVTDKDPLPKLHMEESNWAPPEKSDDDWADYIAQQSARFKEDEELWKELHAEFNGDHAKAHDEYHVRGRKLIEGADLLEWFNYWPMLGVRTEYYYRYSGSQTIPPCYGNFQERSRRETVHWRVMKDPIRIHQRQLDELHRLIKERIAPPDDPVMACKPDTAAGTSKGPVDVARPLQSNQRVNFKVFCECKDWPSKWPEDRDWCLIEDANERFYTHPYNFRTDGF